MLRLAVKNGYVGRVQKLLVMPDIDINMVTAADQKTVLHEAALLKYEVIVELLLNFGGKVIVADGDWGINKSLHLAAAFGLGGLMRRYIDNILPHDSSLATSSSNVGLDIFDSKGRTPLHLAALYNQNEIVKMLLIAHADKSVKDNLGFTPLDLACRNAKIDNPNDLEVLVLLGYKMVTRKEDCIIS
jgi:ankyrin repeat protein